MAEMTTTGRWAKTGVFVSLVALVVFLMLLPMNPGPGRFPGPDVLLLMTFAWLLRRPEYVPVWLIACVFFLSDLLFMRPPGLWAGIVVIASEMLRSRAFQFRDQSILVEWLTVSAVITGMFLAYTIALAVFFVDRPGLGAMLIHLIVTVLVYPIVVALSARMFGVRKMAGGETDQFGRVR